MPDLPDLRGRVRIDTSDLEKSVGRASKAGSMIGSALGTLGGNVASGLLDTAFQGVKALTVGSITAASDLSETANKIKVVFGPAASAVEAFASNSARQFGLSKQSALDASATFGVFGKAAGLTGKDLSGFSSQFVGLAADMASFSNTTPEQAIEALGSGLRGEAEPLRQYGILLDDATLRTEALKLGLISSTKEALTPQQKVLAAQASIMKQTSDAQGDFGRTSDGLANRQRILKAEFSDLQTKLGTGFLPIVNAVLGGILSLTAPLGSLATSIATSVGPAFAALSTSGAGVGSTLTTLRTSLAGLGAALSGAFTLILPTLQSLAATAREQLVPALMSIWRIVATNVIPALSELITALAPVARWLLQAFGPVVISAIRLVMSSIGGLLGVVGNLVRFVARVIKGDWSGAWKALQAAASGVMRVVQGQIKVWLGAIIPGIFRVGKTVIVALFKGAWALLKAAASQGVSNVTSLVRTLPSRIKGALGNLGNLLRGAGRAVIQGLINGITGMLGAVGRAASRVASKIRSYFPGSPVREGPLTSWNNGGAGKRLGTMLASGLEDSRGRVGIAASRLAGSVGGFGAVAPGAAATAPSAAGTGLLRLDPRDLQALGDALGVTVLLDGDALASKVGRRIGADAYSIARSR
jgi:hypothetical protein